MVFGQWNSDSNFQFQQEDDMNRQHKAKEWVFDRDVKGGSPAPGVIRKVMSYCDDAMCAVHEFEKGAIVASHSHPHTQITYVVEGHFRFTLRDETREIVRGDTICMQNDVKHACECLEKGILVDFFAPMREDFV
jgi:quercetin dioxygenase-like cupin family protein